MVKCRIYGKIFCKTLIIFSKIGNFKVLLLRILSFSDKKWDGFDHLPIPLLLPIPSCQNQTQTRDLWSNFWIASLFFFFNLAHSTETQIFCSNLATSLSYLKYIHSQPISEEICKLFSWWKYHLCGDIFNILYLSYSFKIFFTFAKCLSFDKNEWQIINYYFRYNSIDANKIIITHHLVNTNITNTWYLLLFLLWTQYMFHKTN